MLIFAHRGASGYAPENTLTAMEKAIDLGAQAIELDVHNVEGQLMVFHDRRLEKKSSGRGLIHLCSAEALADIRVEGEPIPSLWQVLEFIAGRCLVNIELKGINTLAPFLNLYPRALAELGYHPQQLLISSFNHPYLAKIKQRFPEAQIAPLLASIPLDLAQVVATLNAFSLHLDIDFVNRAIVEDGHRLGAKVYVYTVDDPDDLRALARLGVDGCFCNFPDRALQALSEHSDTDYRNWFE